MSQEKAVALLFEELIEGLIETIVNRLDKLDKRQDALSDYISEVKLRLDTYTDDINERLEEIGRAQTRTGAPKQ